MKQKPNSLNINNPHCLRSKKLNEEQMLLFRQFEGTSKSNKTAYKFLQETINNMAQNNNSINKTKNSNWRAYSPLPSVKRSKSSRNKSMSSNQNKKNSNISKNIYSKDYSTFRNSKKDVSNNSKKTNKNSNNNNNSKKSWEIYDYVINLF